MADKEKEDNDANNRREQSERKNVKFADGRPGDNDQYASDGDKYRSLRQCSHDGHCSCRHNVECRYYSPDRYDITRVTTRYMSKSFSSFISIINHSF
jgi:hypothetical protein